MHYVSAIKKVMKQNNLHARIIQQLLNWDELQCVVHDYNAGILKRGVQHVGVPEFNSRCFGECSQVCRRLLYHGHGVIDADESAPIASRLARN